MSTRHLSAVLRAPLLAALLAAVVPALPIPALAQDTRAAPAPRADAPYHDGHRWGALRAAPVRNAPYSAQIVTERTQALADGNQIATRRTTMSYRDSAGRTRQEYRDDRGDLVTVTIHDPVAGATFVLHPRDRTAVRLAGGGRRDDARAPADRPPHGDGEDVIVKRVEGLNDAERQRIQRDVRIRVSRALAESGGTSRDVQMQVAPLVNGAFADIKWSAKATTKELGTRDIGGVRAEGRLRSYAIPAGEIGNRNPIVVSDETWTAPDLQVTVYTKHSDPRSGDFVFRLENVKRDEPAAALFAVPADYTLRDGGDRWRERPGQGAAGDGKAQ